MRVSIANVLRGPRTVGVMIAVLAVAVGTLATAAGGSRIDGAATARSSAARLAPPAPPPPAPAPAADAAGRQLADLLNAERVRRGLPALAWHGQVAAAAASHSSDMAANQFMSHTGSDGSNTGTRLERAGFTWGAWAENVGAGYPDAAAMFRGWMDSPPHRSNMLGSYRYVGVAEAAGGGALYWTLVVAS